MKEYRCGGSFGGSSKVNRWWKDLWDCVMKLEAVALSKWSIVPLPLLHKLLLAATLRAGNTRKSAKLIQMLHGVEEWTWRRQCGNAYYILVRIIQIFNFKRRWRVCRVSCTIWLYVSYLSSMNCCWLINFTKKELVLWCQEVSACKKKVLTWKSY